MTNSNNESLQIKESPLMMNKSEVSPSIAAIQPYETATNQNIVKLFFPRSSITTELHVMKAKSMKNNNNELFQNENEIPWWQGCDWLWSSHVVNGNVVWPDSANNTPVELVPVYEIDREQYNKNVLKNTM